MIGLDPVSIIVQQGLLLNVTMLVFVMSPSRGALHIVQSELMSLCMYKHMVIHLIAEYIGFIHVPVCNMCTCILIPSFSAFIHSYGLHIS